MFLLPPIGKIGLDDLFGELRERGIKGLKGFYGIDGESAYKLEEKGLKAIPDRNNWNYFYLVEDSISLKGSKYRTKRQNINQCLANYECVYKPITLEVIEDCMRLQSKWCGLRSCELDSGLMAENETIKELFKICKELKVFGGAIYIENRLKVFTVAEVLNNTTALVYFEKANPEIRGSIKL